MSALLSSRKRAALPVALPRGRTVKVRSADGTRLHTEVFGPRDGYPIVLAHGITCAIRAWTYQIAELARDYRVIAFDHRGHGRSDIPPRGNYSLRHLAAVPAGAEGLEVARDPDAREAAAQHQDAGLAAGGRRGRRGRCSRCFPRFPRCRDGRFGRHVRRFRDRRLSRHVRQRRRRPRASSPARRLP